MTQANAIRDVRCSSERVPMLFYVTHTLVYACTEQGAGSVRDKGKVNWCGNIECQIPKKAQSGRVEKE